METIRSNGRSLQYAALIIYSSAVPKHWPCEKNRNSAAIQVNHFDFVASAPAYFSEAGWMWRNRAFYGVECGRNCARRPSDSRPLRGTPPRLLLFPHHGATPSADESNISLSSSTRKRRFRTGMARLQVGQNSWLASNSSKSFCCSRRTSLLSSYHHFAGVSWQQQRRKPPVLEAGARDGVRGDGIIGTYLHGAFKDPASSPRLASLQTSNKPLARKCCGLVCSCGSDLRSGCCTSPNSLNEALVASSKKP